MKLRFDEGRDHWSWNVDLMSGIVALKLWSELWKLSFHGHNVSVLPCLVMAFAVAN